MSFNFSIRYDEEKKREKNPEVSRCFENAHVPMSRTKPTQQSNAGQGKWGLSLAAAHKI